MPGVRTKRFTIELNMVGAFCWLVRLVRGWEVDRQIYDMSSGVRQDFEVKSESQRVVLTVWWSCMGGEESRDKDVVFLPLGNLDDVRLHLVSNMK